MMCKEEYVHRYRYVYIYIYMRGKEASLIGTLIGILIRTLIGTSPGLEKLQRSGVQLSERLASLGIMGAQLRVPLKHPVHHSTIILRGLRNWQHSFLSVQALIAEWLIFIVQANSLENSQ